MLLARARLNAAIRRYFSDEGVLEVETPLLSLGTITDPEIEVFALEVDEGQRSKRRYLQTSPEFAMKRLMAAGAGSIYQITKAFRRKESGRFHNPEFTLLEWYRLGFDLDDLCADVVALLKCLASQFGYPLQLEEVRYLELFQRTIGLHPLEASIRDFSRLAAAQGLEGADALCGEQRAHWLDFLFSSLVQPTFLEGTLTLVRHYPAILPSLARTVPDQPQWVERVEVFLGAVELGNGFHELGDADEQRQRFFADQQARRASGAAPVEMDGRLIEALEAGLPNCSGLALGLDRLLMRFCQQPSIESTLSFSFDRA